LATKKTMVPITGPQKVPLPPSMAMRIIHTPISGLKAMSMGSMKRERLP